MPQYQVFTNKKTDEYLGKRALPNESRASTIGRILKDLAEKADHTYTITSGELIFDPNNHPLVKGGLVDPDYGEINLDKVVREDK